MPKLFGFQSREEIDLGRKRLLEILKDEKKSKVFVARNARELSDLLDLDPVDSIEMEFRAKLAKKIVDAVKKQKLTHTEVAKRAKASRTRVTAILNGNTNGMSTDLPLRVLYSLGYKTKVSFAPVGRIAA